MDNGIIRRPLFEVVKARDHKLLQLYGMRIINDEELAVPRTEYKLKKAMGESRYANTFTSQLVRIDGIYSHNFKHPTTGKSTSCLKIPIPLIIGGTS
jgi:hypothetical protein